MTNPYDPYRPPNEPDRPPNELDGNGTSQPQYGARSENWGQPAPSNPAAGSERPWPTYGQSAPQLGNQYPVPPTDPYRSQPMPGPYVPNSYATPSGPPPSRTWPILTLIGGLVLMIVVAPILLIVLILQGVGFSELIDGSLEVTNGGLVTVDETGAVGLVPMTGLGTPECVLEGAGSTHALVQELELATAEDNLLVARGLNPGTYQLSCADASEYSSYLVFPGEVLNNMVPMTLKAFGWSTLVGIGGLATAIVGLVWLIRRNKAIRRYYGRY